MSFGGCYGSTFQNTLEHGQNELLNDGIDFLIDEELILDIKNLSSLIDEAILNFDDVLTNEILNFSDFWDTLDYYKFFVVEYLLEYYPKDDELMALLGEFVAKYPLEFLDLERKLFSVLKGVNE